MGNRGPSRSSRSRSPARVGARRRARRHGDRGERCGGGRRRGVPARRSWRGWRQRHFRNARPLCGIARKGRAWWSRGRGRSLSRRGRRRRWRRGRWRRCIGPGGVHREPRGRGFLECAGGGRWCGWCWSHRRLGELSRNGRQWRRRRGCHRECHRDANRGRLLFQRHLRVRVRHRRRGRSRERRRCARGRWRYGNRDGVCSLADGEPDLRRRRRGRGSGWSRLQRRHSRRRRRGLPHECRVCIGKPVVPEPDRHGRRRWLWRGTRRARRVGELGARVFEPGRRALAQFARGRRGVD